MVGRRERSSKSEGGVSVSESQCPCKFRRELIIFTEREPAGADKTGGMKPVSWRPQRLVLTS